MSKHVITLYISIKLLEFSYGRSQNIFGMSQKTWAGLRPTRTIWLGQPQQKWTTKGFSFRLRLTHSLLANLLNLGIFSDRPGSGPRLYHQADHKKNQTVHRWRNLESLKLCGTPRRTPRVTCHKGTRQPPITRGFPQWHHVTTSAAGDFQETHGNGKICDSLPESK